MVDERGKPRWLVRCSCGWERECISRWAAESVSKLHRQLEGVGTDHRTHVEAPGDSGPGEQLPLA